MVGRAKGRLLLGFFVLALAGCHRGTAPAPADTLRVQLATDPVSLDPALAEDGVSLRILGNVMEGLVGYDGAGHLRNRLAESYHASQDGKRFEFTLRAGARWSDGRPVVAADFVTGIRRALDPRTASKLAAMLEPIRSVSEQGGKVVIELKRASPYFLQALTLPAAMPEREDVLRANHDAWPETAPATGPYRIAAHASDSRYRLERNPRYWGAAAPIPVVELRTVPDETTGANLFEQGALDVLTKVPSLDFERFRERGWLRSDPFLATYYLAFNVRKPPFDDRDLRRAVAGAIRRDEVAVALGTGERPARGWVPEGIEGYIPYEDPTPIFRDSMKRVRARGSPKRPISAAFDSSGRNSLIMEKVQQDVRRALGIELSLSNLDWKTYLKTLQADAPALYRMGWLAPFADPVPHLQAFTTGNPNNYAGWSDAEYDRLVREVEGMSPGAGREARVRRAQAILVDQEAVVVPLYHYVTVSAVAARVAGFRVNPFGVVRFDELSLSR